MATTRVFAAVALLFVGFACVRARLRVPFDCTVHARAYSANEAEIPQTGIVTLNEETVWKAGFNSTTLPNLSGVTAVLVDPLTCTARDVSTFDTSSENEQAEKLKQCLEALKKGEVVVLVTGDEPKRGLGPAEKALAELDVDVTDIEIGGAFVAVAKKGCKRETVFEKALTEDAAIKQQPEISACLKGFVKLRIVVPEIVAEPV